MRKVELLLDAEENYFMREAFNTLRTNILFSGRDIKTIVVTSCMANEGKTTVTYELARSLAEFGKRVLLVDSDLRKSVMVSRYTKERGVVGLSQLLSGQTTCDQSIYNTQFENLDIIFAGPYPPNPTELVGSDAFKELLEMQRTSYDYIFVDAPPLGLVIDAAVMAGACDAAVLVLGAGRDKYRLAQDVKDQLQRSGCKILGVVLNQIDRKSSGSGYYGAKYSETYGYEKSTSATNRAPSAGQSAPRASVAQPQARPTAPRAPQQQTGATVRRPVQGNPAGVAKPAQPRPQNTVDQNKQ